MVKFEPEEMELSSAKYGLQLKYNYTRQRIKLKTRQEIK